MSEKRFTLSNFASPSQLSDVCDDGGKMLNSEVVDLLNEQQATINELQGQINRLNYIIEELRKNNYKRFEKINELKAKLKEKEEDERLYANEIVELRKTNEEWLEFKELGGDY